MSDMKCPFCQQKIMCMDAQDADEHSNWYCPRCIAERNWYAFGNKTLWQELIRTRKALEIAVDALTRIAVSPETMMEPEKVVPQLADLALEQITALEQKDK